MKKNKKAQNKNTLEKLNLPFLKDYLQIAKLEKLSRTYLSNITRETVDGYMRPTLNLHTVNTFRGSCSSPNYQNLPKRSPLHAKLIRRLFIPRDDHYLLEIDLKANEVRLACCYTKYQKLILDTLHCDMHRDMAAECYMLKKSEVPKPVRQSGKNSFVFAEFYGDYYGDKKDGSPGVARNLWEDIGINGHKTKDGTCLYEHLESKGITELGPTEDPPHGTFMRHIKEVEDRFWNVRYKTYNQWKLDLVESYNKRGYLKMLSGFVVRTSKDGLPLSRNECTNAPVQGAAFHCLLWVLVKVQKWLVEKKMRTRLTGQIHDALTYSVHKDELDDVMNKTFQLLRHDIREEWDWLIVPLEGEAELSHTNWSEMEEIEVPS